MNIVLLLLAYMAKACAVVLLLLLARGMVWLLDMLVIAPLSDPLKNMPGPVASPFQNHFRDVMECVTFINTVLRILIEL